jgi:hypothetical protein
MAANSAHAGFRRLSALLVADGFLPRQLTYRGIQCYPTDVQAGGSLAGNDSQAATSTMSAMSIVPSGNP